MDNEIVSFSRVGSALVARICCEIDHHTAVTIRQGIDATLFERRPARLRLDLSAVSFMDSSGLGLIMGRLSVMRELGGELIVWNPSRETRSILTLAGMERLVRIEYPPNEGQAPAEPPVPTAVGERVTAYPRRKSPGRRIRRPREATPKTTASRKEKDA